MTISKGRRFAVIAVFVWLVGGALIAPFFCEWIGIDPFKAGRALGLLSFLVGGIGFMVGRSLDHK